MNIMLLGPENSPLVSYLAKYGLVRVVNYELKPRDFVGYDYLVSYGYRHIISKDILDLFPTGRAVNLHASYLPWNRGAYPNLWSWVDDTPKGVSIHILNEGLDSGPICNRQLVDMDDNETLASSYAKLNLAMVSLFKDTWPLAVANGGFVYNVHPIDSGSYHSKAQGEIVFSKLSNDWDTPAARLGL